MSEITKIVQCHLPPMVAGEYEAHVVQKVKASGAKIEGEKTLHFGVDAARFRLNPDDIYSVYPPANQFGRFYESLPHVVFSRRTLPWERTIDAQLPACQSETTPSKKRNPLDNPPVPWMAILLFEEKEIEDSKIESRKIAEVIQPAKAEEAVLRPEIYKNDTATIKLMPWESEEDLCLTIDISKEQFETLVPAQSDLSYLAHAKEVSIENKDKNGITDLNEDGSGVFAVIVGNRLPSPGKSHSAVLVSLEGYGDYLKDAEHPKTIPDNHKVRMVVLANWQFSVSGEASFSQLVKGLEVKSLKIKGDAQKEKALLPYFDTGYVGLPHLTRVGASTLSWYHGPLIPKLIPASSKNISFSSADAALRYDKATGFFDVSFAAAWQLGRTLALQNQGFSKAMLNWRIRQVQDALEDEKRSDIDQLLKDTSKKPLKDKVLNYLANAHEVALEQMEEELIDNPATDIPEEVKGFLNDLYQLNGVPFPYLVPHEALLKKEHSEDGEEYTGTLAVFYVDPNWIEALLDGALSIGRVNENEKLLDLAMSGDFIKGFKNQKRKNPDTGQQDVEVRQLNVTGFLLRSDLISGWRGIEIEAYDAKGALLPALRFERIDSDIFLGVFNGNVTKVIITQPYEGLHFGIKVNVGKKQNEGRYQKNLKNEDGSNKKVSDGSADLNIELQKKGFIKDGVLNISRIANTMKSKLTKKGWMNTEGPSKGKYFTSAEFAFQMVDSPVKHTININTKVSS